jgi:two-component system cell cycle sensor histidine kinase/response regulator CckA
MTLRQLVGPDYGEGAQRLIDLAQQGLAPAGGVEVVIPGDAPRSVRLYATRVGKAGSALLFVVDATEQRLLEEQVGQSEKMKAVGQLAGGIAHDFNNLLTAISGYCDLLLQSHPVGDPSFADISQIRQTSARAANLVRQLLAFSSQQTMRPTVVWLNDMLADLKVFLGRVITERISLQVTLGRDLWPIHADPGQIERVIMNLAVNARDAMPSGGKLVLKTYNLPKESAAKLTTVDLRPGDYVVIDVTDTGTGIPKEHLSKIFEPFFTTKNVGEGTGLGLSTAYGIVTQSGGQIAVESQMGAGTSFRIYLPRDERAEQRQEPGHQDLATRMQDLTGKGTILLVEDEDAVRSFAVRALKARGYEVFEAANGEEALETMRRRGRPVDLLISDVVMPGMDGPTLARALREEFGPQKVILISGYAEDAIRKNLENEQNVEFLPKPFSLKELAQKVKGVLQAEPAATA